MALSILVAHFLKREERLKFYRAMSNRLYPNGILIDTEISYDLDAQEFPLMLKNWESIQSLMGATPESIANLSRVLRDMLSVLPPIESRADAKAKRHSVTSSFFSVVYD